MNGDVLRPNGMVFKFQRLGLSEKIPIVWPWTVSNLRFYCSRDLCVIFVLFG